MFIEVNMFGMNGAEWAIVVVLIGLVIKIVGWKSVVGLFRLKKGDFRSDNSEEAGKARAYLEHSHPIAIIAHHRADDTILQRAALERQRLKENGNMWDDDLPIVKYIPGTIVSANFTLGNIREEMSVDLRGVDEKSYLHFVAKAHIEFSEKWENAVRQTARFPEDKILELLHRQKPIAQSANF